MTATTDVQLQEERRQLLVELARSLHEAGAAAHRIEDALSAVASALGIDGAAFFSTPTSLIVSFAADHTTLLRVRPSTIDLTRLAALDEVAEQIVEGLSPAEARARLRALGSTPRTYGPAAATFAFALVSFAVARSFGGGLIEMAASSVLGGLVGAIATRAERYPVGARALELFAAFFVGIGAAALSKLTPMSTGIVTLASLIVLFPGYSLTVAVSEIVTRNLVSGTSRLTAASLSLLQLGVGTALANRIVAPWLDANASGTPSTLPFFTEVAAVAAAAFGLSILFQAPVRAVAWVLVACLVAFVGARTGALLLGPELGVSVGAFFVTGMSNVLARRSRRSPLLTLVPAMVLLVPGSVGYRSMIALLNQETVAGVDFGVSMLLIAVSIVAGMTVANALFSPRRPL